jgi:ribosome biogenesis GTPase A
MYTNVCNREPGAVSAFLLHIYRNEQVIMDIQWFPGHMAKTRKKIIEQLRWVDAVLEVADARVPVSSRNPLLGELIGNKPRIVLLNKADLADEGMTDLWRSKLACEGMALPVSASTGLGMKKIVPHIERLLAEKMKALADKGVRPRPFRIMVAGIPNIGKSTIINRMTAGAKAKTGNKPGVTRDNQWIRVHERVDLLDTPGMLWPKFDDQEAGRKLAVTGAIRDEVFDQEELALWLLEWMKTNYPRELMKYGGVPAASKETINVSEETAKDSEETSAISGETSAVSLVTLGRRRGLLRGQGEVDCFKMAQILLKDFRAGKIGNVTLESV